MNISSPVDPESVRTIALDVLGPWAIVVIVVSFAILAHWLARGVWWRGFTGGPGGLLVISKSESPPPGGGGSTPGGIGGEQGVNPGDP